MPRIRPVNCNAPEVPDAICNLTLIESMGWPMTTPALPATPPAIRSWIAFDLACWRDAPAGAWRGRVIRLAIFDREVSSCSSQHRTPVDVDVSLPSTWVLVALMSVHRRGLSSNARLHVHSSRSRCCLAAAVPSLASIGTT